MPTLPTVAQLPATHSAPTLRRGWSRTAQLCAWVTFLLGALGMAGWLFDQPLWRSVWKSSSEMKFNAALAITCLGSALVLATTLRSRVRYPASLAASFVALIVTLTLLQYIFSTNFGIDELVYRDTNPLGTTHPGRMAWHSALTLLLLATGTILLWRGDRRAIYAVQWLALAATVFPIQALIGYAYSTMAMFGMSAETGYMAVPTAAAFLSGAVALLLYAPDQGIMATLTAPTHTSAVFRRLLGLFLVLPLVLGWLTLHGAGGAQRSPAYNVATVATLTTVLLAGLAWRYVFRLNSAEGALRHSEAYLREFMENASVGIQWIGPNGTILWANKSHLAMLGYTPEEYVGHHIAAFQAGAPQNQDTLTCLTRGETLRDHEARLRCKDGSIRDVVVDCNALFDNGKFIHSRCFIRDVTARKQMEQALRRSEERLRAMFGQAAVGIAVVDCDGRLIEVNPRLCQILGRSSKELCKLTCEDLTHPEDWICNKSLIQDLVKGQRGEFSIEKRYARGDGSWVWVKVAVAPILDPHGRVDRLLAVIEDIQARKRAEEAKAKLAAIVEHSDDAIISKDLDGIIMSWNRAAGHLFGYTAEEAIGQPVTLLIPLDRHHEEPKILERIRNGEAIEQYETVRRRKDGTLIDISLTVSPIRDEQGQIVAISKIARNITDRKRAEAALAEAQAELQQHAANLEKSVEQRTAKLRETIGELESYSYSISHDMRAPLRAMQAYAQVLLNDYSSSLEAPAKRYLDRIIVSSNRLDKLIQDVLSYSRISRAEVRLEPVNLDRLVADIIDEYPTVRASKVDLCQPLGSVVAAEALLTQAVSNLLTNAAKFVVLGQTPQIKVWSETIPSGNCVPATLRLYVQDWGIGIAPEDQQRIFGIFARVHSDRQYDGTGIGLSIVKKAMERMGGEVTLMSEPGKGSIFCLQLPRA